MAGLYIHVPFCRQACHYCDFHFSTSTGHQLEMINAMAHELSLQRDYLSGEELQTIYYGGGTPSILKPAELSLLFKSIHAHHRVAGNAEVTIEVNPDDVSKDLLTTLKGLGVNRLSIGIQSFNDNVLRYFNRVHDAASARASVMLAREAGFNNISIDLIYGIPAADLDHWRTDIQRAIDLKPDHISSYSLTIEKDTVFGRWYDKGKLQPRDDNDVAEQLELLMEELANAGYDHYEISNFSRHGFHSRHNSNYWNQVNYLGIGPSAHSYNGVSRQHNVRNNSAYIRSINANTIPMEMEILTRENLINEFILTRLRTRWGCDFAELKKRYGWRETQSVATYMQELIKNGLAMIHGTILILTNKGKLLADRIASDLFVSSE
jgi:oxygen-independent coproporphyrinogen-3 oxidase